MQPAIDAVNRWAERNGFTFNKNKCYSVLFSKNKLQERPRFLLGGEYISDFEETKYLGLVLEPPYMVAHRHSDLIFRQYGVIYKMIKKHLKHLFIQYIL